MGNSIDRPSRVEAAYDELKAQILDSRLPQGFQAHEPDIASRLGMSRTPVREALLRLEAEGLVELVPRRGARVLPISVDDMQEIYDILTSLEPDAAAKLAETPHQRSDFEQMEAAIVDMEAALSDNDLEKWAVADDRFHRELLTKLKNRRMAEFATRLYDQSHRARLVTLRLRSPPHQSTIEHRAIFEHIVAGEAEEARAAFKAHRRRTSAELIRVLSDYKLTAV